MPIVKAISGHTTCQKVKTYLEKRNRALARDFFNLSWDERDMEECDESLKEFVEWADEMDLTRKKQGNDLPYEGRRARTYKHFVISPDPEDNIDLPALRELACAWATRFFDDYQIAIVYHDDNASNIPHAHLIVNCTNLTTGNRLQTDNPFELNRALQDMARERGLSGLSNILPKKDGTSREKDAEERLKPRTSQPVYMSRPEREIAESGGYSWVSDIRSRVSVARNLARNESEFRQICGMLGLSIADNSARATNRDWIFSLSDEPRCKVTGGRLGYLYSKASLENSFANMAAYHPDASASRTILKAARNAVIINDLCDLDKMANVLETCARHSVRSISEIDARIAILDTKGPEASSDLREARKYVIEKNLLPQKAAPRRHLEHEEPSESSRRQRHGSSDSRRSQGQQQQRQRDRSGR